MIFCNGEFLAAEQPSILTSNRGFLFADGVFTTLKVSEGKIYFFNAHCERFSLHCKVMGFLPPKIESSAICKLIELNNAHSGTWRLKIIATAKAHSEGLALGLREVGSFAMLLDPYLEEKKESCSLKTYIQPIVTPFSRIKSLACAARFNVLEDAKRHGCDDGLVLSPEGYLTETAFANFFWRQGNCLMTPSPALPLLWGITLHFVEIAARQLKLDWQEVIKTPAEIPADGQLFICNSLKGILPVTSYDYTPFARDSAFESQLQVEYNQLADLHVIAH
ncbi:MAG: aminotransferase class IV [Parachlamydiaceae bacterium]|nr:aminotransferase class IV [Parachlamydiaceae bacterium]